MTVNEFWAYCQLPENRNRRLELVRGEVIEFPLPYHKHGFVCAKVGFELGQWARSRGGWVTSNCAGVILPHDADTLVGPDLAYFDQTSIAVDELTGWSLDPPALAVEVASPQDDAAFLHERGRLLLANGVRVVWVVDYEVRQVEVFRSTASVVLTRADELAGGDELPGFACRVADFFRLPGEKPAA